jgi:regulator of protease activity HflC (stomatin/prohibitin superfamily)
MMRAATLWTLAAIAMLGLSGCNKAESPPKVQQDVSKATDSAAEKDAQAADRLAKADAEANKDVANAEAKADQKTTDAAGDAVIAQAEGDHKVAVAQCEALSGQAQKDCKKQADDQLDAVKTKVKQLKKDAG